MSGRFGRALGLSAWIRFTVISSARCRALDCCRLLSMRSRLPRGWLCDGRYGPALPWASPEGAHAGGIFHGRREWHEGVTRAIAGAVSGDQAELACPGDGLGAVGRAELAENVADVFFCRVEGDHEFRGDGLIGHAGGQQPQHL
jgi:hypothetical protein